MFKFTLKTLAVILLIASLGEAKKKPRKTMRYNLDYAVSKVRRQYKGKVIGARTSWRGDEPVHKVKILTEDGRVRTVYVSGSSGR